MTTLPTPTGMAPVPMMIRKSDFGSHKWFFRRRRWFLEPRNLERRNFRKFWNFNSKIRISRIIIRIHGLCSTKRIHWKEASLHRI